MLDVIYVEFMLTLRMAGYDERLVRNERAVHHYQPFEWERSLADRHGTFQVTRITSPSRLIDSY
jgi:hypothetical protein